MKASLRREGTNTPERSTEVSRLVHELQTYQIELELQNEELLAAQHELLESRDRYSDLYDCAPIGYLTVGRNGVIREANLTMARMLNVERSALVNSLLSAFIVSDDQLVYYEHAQRIQASSQRDTCHIRLRRRNDEALWTEMDSTPIHADEHREGGFRTVIIDIAERKRSEERLAFQATHDALTELTNRPEFERRLERVLDTARMGRETHALCYLDLDQFKVVNDTCGHTAGDELLRQVGQLLRTSVRQRDTLARLGGDEFGVLMEHCPLEQARRLATTIHKVIAGFRFVWEGREFRIGVSIGLVPITENGTTVSKMLAAADSACYAAKDAGRNRVHVYHLHDSALAHRHGEMRWVGRIDQALEDQRLQLWSQSIEPVTPLGEGNYFEVLLRLVDERGKIVLPDIFLPAAERYGLSVKLDRWVVGAAFSWLMDHPKRLDRVRLCFINLSGASLEDEQFLTFVQDQFAQFHIPSHKICFEVTETAAMAKLSKVLTFIAALKTQGCRFALDDFGSGFSSFGYLKTLPVEYLKIDGAFVKDIVNNDVSLALVRSINDVAKVMGKRTIAESVENQDIREKLYELGVDYVQGYGIRRPAPIAETAMLDATGH